MEFLKNLFTNDNSVIGLCGFEDEPSITAKLDYIFDNIPYKPTVSLAYKNREHLKNIFGA